MIGPSTGIDTYALIDEGSTVSLVDEGLARWIGARGRRVTLSLTGIGRNGGLDYESERIECKIGGQGSSTHFTLRGMYTVPELTLPAQTLTEKDVRDYEHLRGVDHHPYSEVRPRVLLGQDNGDLVVPREIRCGRKDEPIASRSKLGWTIHGNVSGKNAGHKGTLVLCTREVEEAKETCRGEPGRARYCADRDLHALVEEYFQLEAVGATVSHRATETEERATNILEATTQKLGDRWETGLLWRSPDSVLPKSRNNAEGRLRNLERRLDRDPSYANLYYKEMDKLIDNGYAERVHHETDDHKTWYLPHFGVTHPEKPGKVRVVFDAAAKAGGASLNDQLLTGPDLLKSLSGVLMRFRQRPIAFKADIKDMFLRIRMRPEDRDAQRFLWRGEDRNKKPNVYRMTTVLFGARSSPCSAMYVKDKNAELASDVMPEGARAIKEKCYMDDYLDCANSVEEASKLIKQVVQINQQGGFEMHGWASNDNRALGEECVGRCTDGTSIRVGSNEVTQDRAKTLGLRWDPTSDTFGFQTTLSKLPVEVASGRRRPTKREVLRVIMSVFDPLGLLAPYTIRSKVLLQNVWRSGIDWDTQIHEDQHQEWGRWLADFEAMARLTVPRYYGTPEGSGSAVELHMFCDASERAYAAVGYWRFPHPDGTHVIRLVMSKSRVTPSKPVTIPRLELQGAVLACRLARSIEYEHEYQVTRRCLWTDSQVVLNWIAAEPREYKTFVANRLSEIRESTSASEWRWVPTGDNPADDATRETKSLSRWLEGPEFLMAGENGWPTMPASYAGERHDLSKIERRKVFLVTTSEEIRPSLPEVSRFSSWKQLLRSTATVLWARDRWKRMKTPRVEHEHLEQAKVLLVRQAQRESFQRELAALKLQQPIAKRSPLAALTPEVDKDGLMRVQGRVREVPNAPPFNSDPIIMEGKHPITRLIVRQYHEAAYHINNEAVLNELRQEYWVTKARKTLRTVTSRCQTCKLRRAKPRPPRMADLPPARLAYQQRPFSHCGMDYFGPMTVTIGRRREKRWGVIFTCLTIRAVHLELAASLSTDSAIMAIRRMAARRGQPVVMHSDNGTNLRGAETELKKALAEQDKNALETYGQQHDMRWEFLPPAAPHMGGAWERLIGCVKAALKEVLKEKSPKEEVMTTLLAEVEQSVNSRPLTHVSTDPQDEEALTPNHFLMGYSSARSLPGRFAQLESCTRKQWRTAQQMANEFWRRWLREYLPTLVTRQKWNAESKKISEGDVVLVVDYQVPRNTWIKGLVTKAIPGPDGRVRTARIRTAKGELLRPTVKLIKIADDIG